MPHAQGAGRAARMAPRYEQPDHAWPCRTTAQHPAAHSRREGAEPVMPARPLPRWTREAGASKAAAPVRNGRAAGIARARSVPASVQHPRRAVAPGALSPSTRRAYAGEVAGSAARRASASPDPVALAARNRANLVAASALAADPTRRRLRTSASVGDANSYDLTAADGRRTSLVRRLRSDPMCNSGTGLLALAPRRHAERGTEVARHGSPWRQS